MAREAPCAGFDAGRIVYGRYSFAVRTGRTGHSRLRDVLKELGEKSERATEEPGVLRPHLLLVC